MIIKKITLVIILWLIAVPCLSGQSPLPLEWEEIENHADFQNLDYSTRMKIRFAYFNDYIATHEYFQALDDKTKIKACTEWVKKELNDKDFKEWKKNIDSSNKKRDKCISKAAKEASTDPGFNFLAKKCYEKYPSHKRNSYLKSKYTISGKDLHQIKTQCEKYVHPSSPE